MQAADTPTPFGVDLTRSIPIGAGQAEASHHSHAINHAAALWHKDLKPEVHGILSRL